MFSLPWLVTAATGDSVDGNAVGLDADVEVARAGGGVGAVVASPSALVVERGD
jgi:hypothetical protein